MIGYVECVFVVIGRNEQFGFQFKPIQSLPEFLLTPSVSSFNNQSNVKKNKQSIAVTVKLSCFPVHCSD